MRIPFDWKVREHLKGLLGSRGLYFSMQDKAAKHLSHLDIQEMGGVKGRPGREEPSGQRCSHL